MVSTTKRVQFDAIYLDFAKAFDRVNYKVLLKKLHRFGISGTLSAWFKDYVTDRVQVRVLLVLSGVPQESILGPPLFLLPYLFD